MRFAAVLLGAFAFVGGVDLIVFSPVPVPAACRFEPLIAALDGMPPGLFGYHPRWARYYYRTWPPGVAVATAGVASIVVGVYLRRQRRREEVRELPEVELEVLDQVGAGDPSDASDRAAHLGGIPR
jgi:hypothetical protein